MRSIFITRFAAALVLMMCFGAHSSVCAQEKSGESRDEPARKEIHRQYRLAPDSTVKLSMIAGPVEVDTTTGDSVEVNIVNSAATQADLDCLDTPIEQTPGKLVIRSKSLCQISRVSQRVMLKVPRNINLDLEFIAGHVRIGPTEGMVRLNSIAGPVHTGTLQAADMSSLARGLTIEINELSQRGVRVSSVEGGIELSLADNLNARLVGEAIIGNVTSDIADVKISTGGRPYYQAVIGSGGPTITISAVRGGIRLRKLP